MGLKCESVIFCDCHVCLFVLFGKYFIITKFCQSKNRLDYEHCETRQCIVCVKNII